MTELFGSESNAVIEMEEDEIIEESLGEVVPTELEEYTGVTSPNIPLFVTPTTIEEDLKETITMSDELEVKETTGSEHAEPIDLSKTEEIQIEPQEVDYSQYVTGYGAEIRSFLGKIGYSFKLGVTNKMLERYANDLLKQQKPESVNFNMEFFGSLGEYIIGIGYAEKVEPKSENVPETTFKSPGMSVQTERTEYKQDKNENIMEVDEKRKKRLSANSRWMDRVDFSILFLRSAQWAFILVLIGVAGQAFHVYHVVSNLSDLAGWAKVVNGLLWAVFLSFGLVYFSLKLGRVSDPIKIKKYKRTVNWFIAFDVFANLYYWSFKFVLMPAVLDKFMKEFTDKDGNIFTDVDWTIVNWMTFEISKIQWPQMIAATIFAVSIPFILKAFAGEIDLPAMLDKVFRSYKEETDNE